MAPNRRPRREIAKGDELSARRYGPAHREIVVEKDAVGLRALLARYVRQVEGRQLQASRRPEEGELDATVGGLGQAQSGAAPRDAFASGFQIDREPFPGPADSLVPSFLLRHRP